MRVNDAPTRLEEACRREGLPLTVQRRVIFEDLASRKDHPTAEQIYETVKGRLPGLSKTTVYRVLETLVRTGMAQKIPHPGAGARFDADTVRHHHLVCTRCGRTEDLHDPRLDSLPMPEARGLGFDVTDYSVQFRGVCPACKRGKGRSTRVSGFRERATSARPRRNKKEPT